MGKIYNLGDERVISLLELADLIIKVGGSGSYKTVPFPPDRKVARSVTCRSEARCPARSERLSTDQSSGPPGVVVWMTMRIVLSTLCSRRRRTVEANRLYQSRRFGRYLDGSASRPPRADG